MQLTKQKLKDIVETKTNKDFEKWKAEQLENHMLMLMKKDKEYRQWEDQFIESKVIDMIISDAEKTAGNSNKLGGNQ
ncbi:hypothetical protein [Salinicoccus kekensis]|uniref:Uncharacterized protein n=1 Tax=Salinicoccus kekensis TaxID=714307 RepID=A0A285UT16_9STAP|nr:hypothetical protein [Salinicoccus kekensis]SOC45075.1 hypothetical protein SAMN05878391_2584 [Salinicoccus kekensis]